jgi:rSAM/selenodomain-associated transferase 1
MSGAIAIFVKTPGLSPVKTRLAAKLGQHTAEAFHLASARAVENVAQETSKVDDIHSYFAVAEKSAMQHSIWQTLPCVWQGDGGLGKRMAQVYQTLLAKHDFVILVGADIPQMTTAELIKASAWLANKTQSQLAFAPSVDGGFWLFGGNCDIPQALWTTVTYSVADTGKQFLNYMRPLGKLLMLTALRDVDEPQDLLLLHNILLELTNPLPAQRQLIRFMESLDNLER